MTETIKRTIPILIEHDNDLKATLHAFQQVCNALSPICWNGGKLFSARSLQKHAYHQVKGIVSAQMTCTAIRLVAACYSKRKRKKLSGTVNFKKPFAVFLIGKRKAGRCHQKRRHNQHLDGWRAKKVGFLCP
jgi:putative transposase